MKVADWMPDWRKRDEYPDDLSRYEWMWEFLRRNPRYQEICDELWTEESTFKVSGNSVTTVPVPKVLVDEFGFDFGSSFPHYSSSSGSSASSSTLRMQFMTPIRFKNEYPLIWKPDTENLQNINLSEVFKRKVSATTVFTSLDLSISIDNQLKVIKKIMVEMQKEQGLGTRQSHISKFPNYLRLLDALTGREKSSEVRDVIFKDVIHDNSADSPRIQRFKYARKTALRFRDQDFRSIMIEKYDRPDKDEPDWDWNVD